MDIIDGIIYINLEHRTDRLRHIQTQLIESPVAKLLGIPRAKIHRLNAHYDKKNGPAGCAKSHTMALKLALEKKWTRVMVIEDDFIWNSDTNYVVNNLTKFSKLDISWDVLLLSTNTRTLHNHGDTDSDFIRKVYNAQTTGGYIINGPAYIKKLHDCFRDAFTHLKRGLPKTRSALDIAWKPYQRADNWYAFKPDHLGKQMPSYSDVSKKFRNYENQL